MKNFPKPAQNRVLLGFEFSMKIQNLQNAKHFEVQNRFAI